MQPLLLVLPLLLLQKRVHELKGRRLDAKAAVPKAHLGTAKLTKKMFVGGTGELTDEDFREHFAQFGEIEDAAVSVRQQGQGVSRRAGQRAYVYLQWVAGCTALSHMQASIKPWGCWAKL